MNGFFKCYNKKIRNKKKNQTSTTWDFIIKIMKTQILTIFCFLDNDNKAFIISYLSDITHEFS